MVNFPTSLDSDQTLYLAVNNKRTRLTSAIDELTLTIPVVTTSGFPTSGFITILSDPNDITKAEAIRYTNTTSTTFIASVRGAEGTPALAHRLADNVDLTITASHHNELKDTIIALENFVGTQGHENFLTVDDHGNVLISGTLTTSGNASFVQNVDIKSNLTVTGTAAFGPTTVSTGTLNPVLFVSSDAPQINTTNTFVSISGCTTPSLAAGVDYLAIYTANHAESTLNAASECRIMFGAVKMGLSDCTPTALGSSPSGQHWEGSTLNGIALVTGDGSSSLKLEFRADTTGTAYVGAAAIVAIPLSDRFTDNSDYFYDEGLNSDTDLVLNAPVFPTFTTILSSNFTLAADDYIVIMSVEADGDVSTSRGGVVRFSINGQVYGSEYGYSSTNSPPMYHCMAVAHVASLPVGGVTNFLIEGSSRILANADFRRPRIFAIRKSLFTRVANTTSTTGATTSATSFQDFTAVNTTITPTAVNSPIIVLGTSNTYTTVSTSEATGAIRNQTDGIDYRDDAGFHNGLVGGIAANNAQSAIFFLHKEDRTATTEYRMRFRSTAGSSVAMGRNADNTGGDLSELILWEYQLASAPSLPIDRTTIQDEEIFTGTLVADNVFSRNQFEAATITGSAGHFAGIISGQFVTGPLISGTVGLFSDSVHTNDLFVANQFTVNTISGTTGLFGGALRADTVRGITVTGTNVRASSTISANNLTSANAVTGVNFTGNTGAFSTTLTVSGIPVVTGTLTVRETDGSPSAHNVHTIIVTTGTLTDNGDGTVTINTGSGGGGSGTPGGNDTEVQFNDAGQFGGDPTFTFNKTTDTLSVPNIVATAIKASTISGTTITGTTGQFSGSLSGQAGSFVTSLTVSGLPVSTRMLTVQEQDGDPSITQVHTILVTTGTLTDNGNGVVYINTGGGGGSGNPGGLNTEIQFNDGGVFGGDANFTFNKTTDTLFITTVTGTTASFERMLTASGGLYYHDLDVQGGLTVTGTAHFGITTVSTGTLTPVLFASNDTPTTTTGTTLISAGCTTSALAAGVDYLVMYSANHGSNTGGRSSIAQALYGSTVIGEIDACPSTLTAADGNQWDSSNLYGIYLVTGDGASTLDIRFARDAGTNVPTAIIGAQAIVAIPLSDRFTNNSDYFFDGVNLDAFLVSNIAISPTFTTIQSTNFTMDAGDYIVMMSIESDAPASTSRGFEVRFSVNGQQIGPNYRTSSGPSGTPNFRSFCVAHVVNIPLTGTINFLIEAASFLDASSDFRRTRIFAIKKSLFTQVISTIDSTGTSTTSTSFQDFTGLSSTITPTALNSQIIVLETSNVYTTNGASASLAALRNETDGVDYRDDAAAIDSVVVAGNFKQTPLFLIHKENRSSATEYRARLRSSDGNSVTIGRNTANTGGDRSELIVWEYSLASAPSLPIDRTTIDDHRILTGSLVADDITVREDLVASTISGSVGHFAGIVSGDIVRGVTVTGVVGQFSGTASAQTFRAATITGTTGSFAGDLSGQSGSVTNTWRAATVTGTTGQFGGNLSANRLNAVSGTFSTGITVGGSTTYIYPNEIRTPTLTADNVSTAGPVVSPTGTFSTSLTISGASVMHTGITGITVSGANLTKGQINFIGSRGGNVSVVGNTITFDANPAGAGGGGAGIPGGNTTEVQYNDGGAFAGDPDFTFDSTTNTLSVPAGNFSTSLTLSGVPVSTGTLTVMETDGSPVVSRVHTLIVTTGTLTDLGDGVARIITGPTTGSGGLSQVADDPFPALGGNLAGQNFNISDVNTLTAVTVHGTTVTGSVGQIGGTLSADVLRAITVTGTAGRFGENLSSQSLTTATGTIVSLGGTNATFTDAVYGTSVVGITVQGTTVTGTLITTGGSVSAHSGSYSNSLTLSGLPVLNRASPERYTVIGGNSTTADTVWTNMPAARTFLGGVNTSSSVRRVDTADKQQVKITVSLSVVAVGIGAVLSIRGNSVYTTTVGDYTDVTVTGACSVNISGTADRWADSGWMDLKPNFRRDGTFFCVAGSGSNGTADPAFGFVEMAFR